jgi:hypothetical protein
LSLAIERNSERLQNLELDFVNWPILQDDLGYESDDGDAAQKVVCRELFGLTEQPPLPIFPAIRELSLTQVPLVAAMARAINFDTLRSLTLRTCPDWHKFLTEAMELDLPTRLKRLEIQDCDNGSFLGYDVIYDFLATFQGLEELFVSYMGPEPTLQLWNQVILHHATLKRLVHHQRTVNLDDESPYFEEMKDLPDLAILSEEIREIKGDPSQNPLARLDLDFIGLCCIPERLVRTEVPRLV